MNLKKLLGESLLIVFSILFALFINEWRNNYKETLRTETLINNISGEIESNKDFIEKWIPYHETILTGIEQAFTGDSLETVFFGGEYFEIYKVAPRGILQGKINNIAWEIAKQDRISNRVNLDTSTALAEVYAQQDIVKSTIDRIIDILSAREAQRKEYLKETAVVFGAEMNELTGQEKRLYEMYEKVLELLINERGQ